MTKRERKYGIRGLQADEGLTMAERGAYELDAFMQPVPPKPKKNNQGKRKRVRWPEDDDT